MIHTLENTSNHYYSNSGYLQIEPDWRVPPIQDPFYVQSGHFGYTPTHWAEYNQADFQQSSYQTKPRQNRRGTADLDKKRVHKCSYQGKLNY